MNEIVCTFVSWPVETWIGALQQGDTELFSLHFITVTLMLWRRDGVTIYAYIPGDSSEQWRLMLSAWSSQFSALRTEVQNLKDSVLFNVGLEPLNSPSARCDSIPSATDRDIGIYWRRSVFV